MPGKFKERWEKTDHLLAIEDITERKE